MVPWIPLLAMQKLTRQNNYKCVAMIHVDGYVENRLQFAKYLYTTATGKREH